MARRLKTTAKYINENCRGLSAEIVQQGRRGSRMVVKNSAGRVLLNHDAADYRATNAEVEYWLYRWEQGDKG